MRNVVSRDQFSILIIQEQKSLLPGGLSQFSTGTGSLSPDMSREGCVLVSGNCQPHPCCRGKAENTECLSRRRIFRKYISFFLQVSSFPCSFHCSYEATKIYITFTFIQQMNISSILQGSMCHQAILSPTSPTYKPIC